MLPQGQLKLIYRSNHGGRRESQHHCGVVGTRHTVHLLVALRLYTRLLITRCRGWDDLFVTIALVRFLSFYLDISTDSSQGKRNHLLSPNPNCSLPRPWEARGRYPRSQRPHKRSQIHHYCTQLLRHQYSDRQNLCSDIPPPTADAICQTVAAMVSALFDARFNCVEYTRDRCDYRLLSTDEEDMAA